MRTELTSSRWPLDDDAELPVVDVAPGVVAEALAPDTSDPVTSTSWPLCVASSDS